MAVPFTAARGVEAGGILFFSTDGGGTDPTEVAYAGSRKTAAYATGTVSATLGSATVTGVGSAWLANVDAGMILVDAGTLKLIGVVKSVESDTSLTLQRAAAFSPAAVSYSLAPALQYWPGVFRPIEARRWYFAAAGQRLIRAADNRAYLSVHASDDTFASGAIYPGYIAASTDYHELPHEAVVIGADSIADTAVLFTTSGSWAIGNLAYDLTDAAGNAQHTVARVNDLILWGDSGITAWRGSLVVPAIDDVYLMALGAAPVPVSSAITPLYRSYVKAGYKPGKASVHRSHYFLPVLDASDVPVDTLVCRLDGTDSRGLIRPGWVRWANHAGTSRAFAERIGATTRQPRLLGLNGLRLTNLSECFVPTSSNKNEADASTHNLTIITRDYATRRTGTTVWKYLRARFELTDAATDNPTFTLEYQLGPPSGTWTAISGAAAESDGTDDYEWAPDARSQAIRFRIKSSGPAAKAVLRSLELFYRQSGRR
jgi:hypothetical protein